MREVIDELELDAHGAAERDVLDDNVLANARNTLPEPHFEHDLRVDLPCSLSVRHIQEIVGREGNFPLHDDNVCARQRERSVASPRQNFELST